MIVVDASLLIELVLRTPFGEALEPRLLDPAQTLHVPHLVDLEVAHVFRRYARTGRVGLDRCSEALSDFRNLPLRRYAHDFLLFRIWELRDNFTAYDAAYVALAEGLDAPLLTHDRRLAAAAGHEARIEFL